MEKLITGRAYVLGSNIDTDQIIPAEHLVYSLSDPEEAKKYGHFALSGVPLEQAGLPNGQTPFISGDNYLSEFNIIIGRIFMVSRCGWPSFFNRSQLRANTELGFNYTLPEI